MSDIDIDIDIGMPLIHNEHCCEEDYGAGDVVAHHTSLQRDHLVGRLRGEILTNLKTVGLTFSDGR